MTGTGDAERDLRLVLAVQGLRAFGYGFSSVLLGTALAASGLSTTQVGAVFAAMLAGMACFSLLAGRYADRLGRRRSYLALLIAMGISAAVFALTDSFPLLLLAAFTGTLSTDPNESGPITTLEQAMIASAPAPARAQVFGRYNAIAYLAGSLGALFAGGPAALRGLWPDVPADQRWLLILTVSAFLAALVALRLSDSVEPPAAHRSRGRLAGSRSTVRRLCALFAVDAFAGGFVVQAFLVYWFVRRYDATPELMGAVFFAAGLLQAASSVLAGKLGERIGLLNTMVFSHLPSNLLLAALPFAPTLPVAVILLLARSALSQMDVPRPPGIRRHHGRPRRTHRRRGLHQHRALRRTAGCAPGRHRPVPARLERAALPHRRRLEDRLRLHPSGALPPRTTVDARRDGACPFPRRTRRRAIRRRAMSIRR